MSRIINSGINQQLEIMIQENIKENLVEVKEEFEEYVTKRIDLVKLHIVEDLSKATSRFGIKLGVSYLLFFVLLFFSLAGAFYLGEILSSLALGFIIIGSFYLVVMVIFYLLRRILVERPVIKSFINLLFPKYDDDEE